MIDLTTIPTNPGCYLFKDSHGKIIYVGKAKNLAKRVKSYFQKTHEEEKTKQLVKQITAVDFFVTNTEVEALILENNLIKKYWPKYNINLKDSRRYAYIEVTNEEYPRLLIARKKEANKEYYGPFVSGAIRDAILEALIKTFKIRTCKKLPRRACLRYSIGLCSAPCIQAISKGAYEESITAAKMVLKGDIQQVKMLLKEKMLTASKNQHYEGALEARNQLASLEYLEERQSMERTKKYDEDIINFIQIKDTIYLLVFHARKGILESKQEFELENTENFFEEFITQYYSEAEIPTQIIIPKLVDTVVETYLTKMKGSRVELITPKKGELKRLLDLVKRNLEITHFGDYEKIELLMKALKLHELPQVIECFDISHLGGTQTVASMVQFRGGKPDKTNYRRYRIRTVHQIDDFASMNEVVTRRYTKLKKEGLPMPNLIVIDGGKGQLHATIQALNMIGVQLPVISLAKREEEIFVPGKSTPIILSKKNKALQLLQSIRDEAHRFAITYNRLLRKKALLK